MDNAVDGDRFLDAMFVNEDGVELNAENPKLSCAALLERVICACEKLICISIFAYN